MAQEQAPNGYQAEIDAARIVDILERKAKETHPRPLTQEDQRELANAWDVLNEAAARRSYDESLRRVEFIYRDTGKTSDEVKNIAAQARRLSGAGWTTALDKDGNKTSAPLSDEQRLMVAEVAHAYGLDPILGEVYLLGNKVYVGLGGLRRKVHEGALDIVEFECKPATEEQRAAARVKDFEQYWICRFRVRDKEFFYEGHGYAEFGNVGIARDKDLRVVRNMAENRAEARALRKAMSISVPTIEEMHLEAEVVDARTTPADGPADQEVGVKARAQRYAHKEQASLGMDKTVTVDLTRSAAHKDDGERVPVRSAAKADPFDTGSDF